MCRLFGFRSIIPSQVHKSLLGAENALVWQSEKHPDGWGVGYFIAGVPHVIKSAETAIQDALFRRVSGIVSSHTVVAHLRKATKGSNSLINSHPFQYGRWIFAHNGDVANFEDTKGQLIARVSPELRRFILGDTDSEVIFHMLLGHLDSRLKPLGMTLHDDGIKTDVLTAAVLDTVRDVEEVTGLGCYGPPGDVAQRLLLSFVVTNGDVLLAHQGGKELFFSTYKVCCSERDVCPSFGPSCEQESPHGARVNHLVLSSEVLHGENVWTAMMPGDVVAVDGGMNLHKTNVVCARRKAALKGFEAMPAVS